MRRFTAYELNILNEHGIDPQSVDDMNIPVEYIVGEAEFCEYRFQVNKSTLIPRVESEYLIELGLRCAASRHIIFADIGCGSGAIGLTFGMELVKRNTSFKASLSDVSEEALSITRNNFERHKTRLRLNKTLIFNSNLLKSYSKDEKIDIIFANLPYIPTSRIQMLAKSVKDFEPTSALDGGVDGLKFIRELLDTAKDYLSVSGTIILEVDDLHKDASEFSKDWLIEVKNDFNGRVRYWVCKFIKQLL